MILSKNSPPVPIRYFAILFFAIFIVYFPALFSGFIWTWDDNVYVLDNPLIKTLSIENLKLIFTTSVNQVYSPLSLLSFAVEYRFFGLTPVIYHATNLVLHFLSCALILKIGTRLGLSAAAAFCGALIFAIHPIHVESVAWVSERKDVLCAVFYLMAVSEYLIYAKTADRRRFYMSIGLGLLSMLAKPMALSLPIILLVLDWMILRPLDWLNRFKEKIWYLVYIVPLAFCSFWSLSPGHFKPATAVLNGIYSFTFYPLRFFVPSKFSPHYELPKPEVWYHPEYWLSAFIFILTVYSVFRFQKNRWFLFAWAYYAASIFFLLRLQNVSELATANLSPLADRFMYLPSLGFCLWSGKIIGDGASSKILKIYLLVFASIIFYLGKTTFDQTKIWISDVSLWSCAVSHNSNDPLALINRARALQKLGKYDSAIGDYTAAIKINPGYYISELGSKHPAKYAVKIDYYNNILLNNPYYVLALRERGVLSLKLGRADKALSDFEEILRVIPVDRQAREFRDRLLAGR